MPPYPGGLWTLVYRSLCKNVKTKPAAAARASFRNPPSGADGFLLILLLFRTYCEPHAFQSHSASGVHGFATALTSGQRADLGFLKA
jgi:hypothetical protein